MKIVTHIAGFRVTRPGKVQKNPDNWKALQTIVRERQRSARGVHCGACWLAESDGVPFELHHRHYNNWGNEQLEDVVLLCALCHEAITSRIRSARAALGDRSPEVMGDEPSQIRVLYRPHAQVEVTIGREATTIRPTFRP